MLNRAIRVAPYEESIKIKMIWNQYGETFIATKIADLEKERLAVKPAYDSQLRYAEKMLMERALEVEDVKSE
jgi:hypothetical protein